MAQFGSNYPYGKSVFMDDGPLPHVTTVLDVIKRALRLLGVSATGETPDSVEVQDAFRQLNWMLDSWSNEKVMAPCMNDLIFPTTAYKNEYTIGSFPGADFITPRPLKIERAFFRRNADSSFPLDVPVSIIDNITYQGIVMKAVQCSWPLYLNYVMTPMPTGKIKLWPVPTMDGAIGLVAWSMVSQFDTVQDQVNLPPGYLDAMAYNLAVEIAPEFGQEAPVTVQRKAMVMKRTIAITNTEVPVLNSDAPRQLPSIYRIEVDGYVG